VHAGKAAAVPAILSDEELFLVVALGWATLLDAATDARLDPAAVLAASFARASGSPLQARLKRATFADLWAKGYRMTSGIKFGVDWLAYRCVQRGG
jgi:tRNA splicing endonuclease